MKNMKRRIAGVVLILLLAVIVLSPASFSAWADLTDENPDSVEIEESEGIIEGESDELGEVAEDETTEGALAEEMIDGSEKQNIADYNCPYNVGDTIYFGKYEQDGNEENGKEDIEWQVLKIESDRVLVVSKYALDCIPYNAGDGDVTWETCSLRNWLNNAFKNAAFSAEEQEKIPTVAVANSSNSFYGTSGGNDTLDQIFCLSLNEIENLIGYSWYDDELMYGYSQKMIAEPTPYAIGKGAYSYKITEDNFVFLQDYGFDDSIKGYCGCWWWLRSPGFDNRNVCSVDGTGLVGRTHGICTSSNITAVRPALFVDISSLEKTDEEPGDSEELSQEEVEEISDLKDDNNIVEVSDKTIDGIKGDDSQITDEDLSEEFDNKDTNVDPEEGKDVTDEGSTEENTDETADVTHEDADVASENKNEIVDDAGID